MNVLTTTPKIEAPRTNGAGEGAARPHYNVAIGYLRAFARFLVFAFHSVIAYYKGVFPMTKAVLRMSVPVTDTARFAGARILIAFNEISMMSLLFFLSGLFLWPSLSRKGAGHFARERLVRLGAPFLVSGGLVAAIAYYPAYLQSGPAHPSVADYVQTWLTPGRWITGPAWFLLILLIFDALAIALFLAAPKMGEWLGKLVAGSAAKPVRFCLTLMLISAIAYMPLALIFGAYSWWHIGPFWLQKSRALHYAVYFFTGVAVGAYGLDRSLASPAGNLGRRWAWWSLAAIAAFLISANVIRQVVEKNKEANLLWASAADLGWVICCAICCLALIAIFVRFARRNVVLDSFANNSYGMYLVHYAFVTWTQFALIEVRMAAALKALCVLFVTIVGWTLAATLRRIPAVRRNI